MARTKKLRFALLVLLASITLPAAAGDGFAMGSQGGKKEKAQKDEKNVDKDAKKLGQTAEKAGRRLGRDSVFCILAAHTSLEGYDTGQQLKDRYTSLGDFPFGQFVAAVLMADRTELSLDTILEKLQEGMSIGQIAKEAGANMGELRGGFGQFRSELARSMTNPPTNDCLRPAP